MATPAEIAAGSTCFTCLPDKISALLYLFAEIAGVTDPATIAANSVCYSCIPDKQSALLYLADVIASNSGGGAATDQVACGAVPPVAAPTGACSIYYDTASTAFYFWNGAAWVLKV